MTSASIWGQATPSPAPSYGDPGATATYGTIFQLSEAAALTGIWYYSAPSDAVLPAKCGIWNMSSGTLVSGTENTAPSWSGARGSGWVKCTYDGTVTLAASTQYATAVYWGATTSKGFQTGVTYPITRGIVTAPAADSAGLKNAPFQTEFWTVPATDGGGGFNWFVDVEVTAAPTPFTATLQSTSGGVQTWSVTSEYNGPDPSVLRIVPPVSPSGSHPHSFLIALPVDTDQSTTFGDPVSVISGLGAPNAYNTTLVVPSFPIQPWYADNPGNADQRQESFILALASWLLTSGFASGGEKVNLIGFSKSGIGGQGLILRNPAVFARCASWDAPFSMTSYDGSDAFSGPVGGGPASAYGTSGNFTSNYELSDAHLATWRDASDFATVKRLWIGGYSAFQGDVADYHTRLTSAGILHAYAPVSASAHNWAPTPGWAAPALAFLFSAGTAPSGLLMSASIV